MAKKILVVDDEEDICRLISRALENEGYEVYGAFDGKEALSKVYDVSPDLVVMDVLMPKMNGYQASEQIRKDPLYRELPILMLTVKDSKEDKMRGFDSGVDEYMIKPFDVTEVVARVKVVLERS